MFHYRRTSEVVFKEVFHAHLEMEFTYVHEGCGNLIIEGTTYPIGPGMLMVFHPFQLHRVQMEVKPGQPFVRSMMMFDPATLQPYWDPFPGLKGFFQLLKQQKALKPVMPISESDPLVSLMGHFHESRAAMSPNEIGEEFHFFLLGYLRQLRRIWQDQQPEAESTGTSRYHHHAEEIMKWIELHYHEPFRLEQMAAELHLSRYHLAHLFKEATGTTILAYVQATRIRHACVWLTKSKSALTVPEIGARVGIPNPSHFCKVFRETMGITPHQYRLNIQKN
ncbi:AraC family transcriptional regulator [Paenibacillus sp. NPDC056579]|uniref:AraC family transcriptional regulator n=1 Tax=Paenibacillus sp. NPDC056579 TaxID=3345871 RepID=UPI0036A0FA7A